MPDAGGCDGAIRGRGGIRSLGRTRLFEALEGEGIRAVWREGLGGRRAALKESINLGWRNESFRGYADYMQTPEFGAEIDWLVGLPECNDVTVMCAEAVPWRCHRSLIADAVLARGVVVEDIFVQEDGRSSRKSRAMTEFATGGGGTAMVSGGKGDDAAGFVWG